SSRARTSRRAARTRRPAATRIERKIVSRKRSHGSTRTSRSSPARCASCSQRSAASSVGSRQRNRLFSLAKLSDRPEGGHRMSHADTRRRTRLVAFLSPCVAPCALLAQQSVPFANGIPVAPELPLEPIPAGPVEYQTAEGQKIRVVVVARGIARPWSIAFLPDDVMLVTETHGKLRVIRNGVLDPAPVEGVPEVRPLRRSGLLDLALHPRFAENRYVYLTYHKPVGEDQAALTLACGVWDGRVLRNVEDLFVTQPSSGTVSRIVFGPDGTIYMSTAGGDAQDPSTHAGKILRL